MNAIPSSMLAAVNHSFGPPDVVQIQAISTPQPKTGEILVRIHASTVSAGDWRLRTRNVPRGFGLIVGLLFGFRKPKYQSLGTDLAGEVVQVGDGVNNFKVGDRVMANLGMKLGGHAQFIAIPEDSAIVRIPDRLSFNEAAALIFGGTTSLFFLKNCAKIQPGEKLLVIGAGGAVGSSAIQIGKALGAKVTAICSSEKFDAVRRLGIDSLFDYKKTDWRTSPERYDVIFDTVGGTNYENCKNHLNPNGRLLLAVADLPLMLNSAWHSVFSSIKIYAGSGKENSQDLKILCDLWSQGTLRPLIGQTFPLEKIADAHRVVETGHKLGSIVVEI